MNYVPIRVSTLRGDQKISFDVFIRINDKYIHYLKQGDSFEGVRLSRLREKKLKKMFIVPDHENQYRSYLMQNIDMAYDPKSQKPLETRAQIAQGYQQSQTEELMERPEDSKLYQSTKDVSLKFAEFLKNEKSALAHIMSIENVDKNLAHHGVNVAALSVSLYNRLGLSDNKQLTMLTLGATMHDFEHTHTHLNVARPVKDMSPEEQKIYTKHPLEGARRLATLSHFDKTILNIISEHEEYIDGKGFPQGLKESQLDPLSVIVGSANAMDRRLSFEGIPKKDVAKQIMITAMGQRPLQHLQLLSEIIA